MWSITVFTPLNWQILSFVITAIGTLPNSSIAEDIVVPYVTLEDGFGDPDNTVSDHYWAKLFPGKLTSTFPEAFADVD